MTKKQWRKLKAGETVRFLGQAAQVIGASRKAVVFSSERGDIIVLGATSQTWALVTKTPPGSRLP